MFNTQAPAAVPGYPLHRRLGEPRGTSGQARKISAPTGFKTRTIQPQANCYTVHTATKPTRNVWYFWLWEALQGPETRKMNSGVPSTLKHQYCQRTHLTTLKSLFTKRRIKILSTFRLLFDRKTKNTRILQSSVLKMTGKNGQWGFPRFFSHSDTAKVLDLYKINIHNTRCST
jgi:hypothetical protein